MFNTRHMRMAVGLVPIVVSAAMIGVVVWAPAATAAPASDRQAISVPLTEDPKAPDPFNGAVPGDVSDGNGALPPARNSPAASPLFENALPGANLTQTRFGPIDDIDRLFLIKVREAGLWERPTCLGRGPRPGAPGSRTSARSSPPTTSSSTRRAARSPAAQRGHARPAECRPAGVDARVRPVARPRVRRRHGQWLRFAHGGVFAAIASVRAGTRNEHDAAVRRAGQRNGQQAHGSAGVHRPGAVRRPSPRRHRRRRRPRVGATPRCPLWTSRPTGRAGHRRGLDAEEPRAVTRPLIIGLSDRGAGADHRRQSSAAMVERRLAC